MYHQVILVTDASKFNRKSLAFICALDQIDVGDNNSL